MPHLSGRGDTLQRHILPLMHLLPAVPSMHSVAGLPAASTPVKLQSFHHQLHFLHHHLPAF